MAPFGKNFLKARLKNRAKEAEETPGKEIQVSVCKEEKAVCGVTKHTTCASVVQALLDDHRSLPESRRLLHGEPKEFCLVERWRGFERPLPPLTRILRLWNAWGDEKSSVQFVLVKTSDCAPPTKAGKRSSRSRSSTASPGGRARRREQCPAQYAKNLPVERQKRLVKKAFRKLERIRRESELATTSPTTSANSTDASAAASGPEGSEEIDSMVRLIISQDHTIRQQLQRMRELDQQIEMAEWFLRRGDMEATSLAAQVEVTEVRNSSDSSPRLSLTDSCASQRREEDRLCDFVYTNDSATQLEEQLQLHQELILELSHDIDTELRRSEWTSGEESMPGAMAAIDTTPDVDLDCPELKTIRADLEHSMRAGLSLYLQSQELERELQCHDSTLLSKTQECQLLAAQLSTLHLGEASPHPGPSPIKSLAVSKCGPEQKGLSVSKTTQGLMADAADTDSDTGISSTHSQDSLSPTVIRRPPPDTEV